MCKAMYQEPKFTVLSFEECDVLVTSGEGDLNNDYYDKGVEDFFGNKGA